MKIDIYNEKGTARQLAVESGKPIPEKAGAVEPHFARTTDLDDKSRPAPRFGHVEELKAAIARDGFYWFSVKASFDESGG